jgi:hypothetical protein
MPKVPGLVAAGVELSKVAVTITHARSNEDRTQFEQTRILFDFVRAAFASSRTLCTNLSRRLRDGVSLESEVVSSSTATAATSLRQSWVRLPRLPALSADIWLVQSQWNLHRRFRCATGRTDRY